MNSAQVMPRGIFLEIVRFAPGSRIPLIQTGAGGSEYQLRNANTPQGTELIRGFLYALLIGDHFLYVNREIAMNRNEAFLEWMLGTKTGISTPDLSLRFTPTVNIEELPSVQRMVLRPREAADAAEMRAGPGQVRTAETRADTERLSGSTVFGILKAAHFTDERIAALEAEGVDIELKLEVYFKSDGSKYEISRDQVSDLIRDVPEDELTLYSHAGRERSGHIKRVAYPAQVETEGELFDRPSISGALWDAFNHFNRQGYV
ncbi:hypothetical protein [Methylobacterium radiodurans]|uniref:Uncharacterized protein n=1 Tax=Methylobacterium radiodurans TaxID=2202828 RepID=A0A2U8VQX0_9HYPH|nr:hypothetical protein [Methylobacterium radiodurans]AWN35880.1 hypothetical protein DK427_09120 [Methylobacterium radiodurans]